MGPARSGRTPSTSGTGRAREPAAASSDLHPLRGLQPAQGLAALVVPATVAPVVASPLAVLEAAQRRDLVVARHRSVLRARVVGRGVAERLGRVVVHGLLRERLARPLPQLATGRTGHDPRPEVVAGAVVLGA